MTAILHESAGFQEVAQMASQQQCNDRRFRCDRKNKQTGVLLSRWKDQASLFYLRCNTVEKYSGLYKLWAHIHWPYQSFCSPKWCSKSQGDWTDSSDVTGYNMMGRFGKWSVCFHCSICVLDFPHCVVHEMPELTAESLVSQIHCQPDTWLILTGGRSGFPSVIMTFVCVRLCLLGSRRHQPVLLEKPVFLYQSAENIKQADQVETLQDHGE